MRLTIQRVKSASVTVENELVGKIGYGILVLLGFSKHDTDKNIKKAAQKMLKIRLWDTIKDETKENQKIKSWATNLVQNKYDILVVSQFTLYGYMNGNKPDFHNSMKSEQAKVYYEEFIQILRDSYPNGNIQTGAFGQMMNVSLENDGPVTFNMEYEG